MAKRPNFTHSWPVCGSTEMSFEFPVGVNYFARSGN